MDGDGEAGSKMAMRLFRDWKCQRIFRLESNECDEVVLVKLFVFKETAARDGTRYEATSRIP